MPDDRSRKTDNRGQRTHIFKVGIRNVEWRRKNEEGGIRSVEFCSGFGHSPTYRNYDSKKGNINAGEHFVATCEKLGSK